MFIQTHDGSTQAVERMDHKRYCVKAAVSSSNPSEWLLATIGWDSRLNIYRIPKPQPGGIQELDPPVSTLTLQSIPEDIIWLPNPNPVKNDDDKNGNEDEILLLSRRDSSLLYYYAPTSPEPTLLGTQNLAPHALSRSILTPSSISLCPTDPTLLAAAIPSLPHLKLIITRLLVPLSRQTNEINRQSDLETAKREESAILQHISTLAPQTPYSTPKVVWRPDGSGVWVNGDDGCIRGIEVSTGKIVASLTGGHEGGVKVRTLWAGYVGSGKEEERSREEWVISGGFDRKVVVWRVGEVL